MVPFFQYLPLFIRLPLYYRLFSKKSESRPELYEKALGIPQDASQQILRSLGFRCEQISPDEWHAHKG